MIKDEKLRSIHHQLKSTIFMPDGSLCPVLKEKRTICNVHLILAHKVFEYVASPEEKVEMLNMINEAYDMGKRMDRGLAYYRNKLGLSKSNGKKLEKKVIDDWSNKDVISSSI
jgi:hypothetical protein